MNESNFDPASGPTLETSAALNGCVRRNPGSAIVVAIALGLAIGFLIRSLRPRPTLRGRISDLLEEFEDRLREVAAPALRKSGVFASEKADALQKGVSCGEARIQQLIGNARDRLWKLISSASFGD